MHLGNSIICPVTGIPMLAIMGITAYYAFKKANLKKENIPLTIVLTTLVFALQMINFSIPQTGSSGHIIGTTLLAALLGPSIAFLAMALIILTQAIFFADGGILALGCNIFNMAFLPCFIIYPLLFKPLNNSNKPILACILSSVLALQLGSLAVVTEAFLSGTLSGNIANFLSLMQFIHLPIGLIEGLFTAVVVIMMKNERFIQNSIYLFGVLSIILAGFISKYASNKPDGLEWSLLNISDSITLQTQGFIYNLSEAIQNKTAILLNQNSLIANISGILLIAGIIYLIGKIITIKTTENNG